MNVFGDIGRIWICEDLSPDSTQTNVHLRVSMFCSDFKLEWQQDEAVLGVGEG